ncbi:hypothetical protein [Streptomyces sp. NPDC098781]|uniref:hypothetical protein n=1 Tax=Streptomyces sp. NPDC098781 TaxID=3366097 RepID=UPI00382151EC
MVSESRRKRTIGLIAGAVLVVTVGGITGCSKDSDSDSAAEDKPGASSSSAPDPGQTPGGDSTAQPVVSGRPTAEEAVGTWVTEVIKGRPKKACLVMAQPADGSAPAQVGNPKTCNSDAPDVKEMRKNIGRFREAFTPKPPTGDPEVEVAEVAAKGGKAVVPAEKVTVDGQTLDKVILSNSTGLEPGQLDVSMESTEIKGAWYVTDINFDVG